MTVIEILSPTNKTGSVRIDYIKKRKQWIRQPVNVVEIDLLLGGHRLPVRGFLPTGDYYAFVSRSNRRPNCDVYAWSIRRELPAIPIPLSIPDPDVLLDLRAVFAQTYDGAPYGTVSRSITRPRLTCLWHLRTGPGRSSKPERGGWSHGPERERQARVPGQGFYNRLYQK